jgi:hypothetical protein
MSSWKIEKKTIPQALADVKAVYDGAPDVRLIDQKHTQSSAPDCLIGIDFNPSDVVREMMDFDRNNPGGGGKVTKPCPVPGCNDNITINLKAPPPEHRVEFDSRMTTRLRDHLRERSSKHGNNTTPLEHSDGTNGPADAHALLYSLLPVSDSPPSPRSAD